MRIEQITEFELRGSGLPDHACTVANKTGQFYGKLKISKSTLRGIYNLLLQVLQ